MRRDGKCQLVRMMPMCITNIEVRSGLHLQTWHCKQTHRKKVPQSEALPSSPVALTTHSVTKTHTPPDANKMNLPGGLAAG